MPGSSGCRACGTTSFLQTTHACTIHLEADAATGRAYTAEFGLMRNGGSHLNHAIYHDRYQRTPDGWKFAERIYEVLYQDNSPLTGTAPTPPRIRAGRGGGR